MTSLDRLARFLDDCCGRGVTRAVGIKFRLVVRPYLRERMSMVSSDRGAVDRAIDVVGREALPRLSSGRGVNWRAWLLAYGIVALAEDSGTAGWLDRFAPGGHPERAARRRIVVCAILTLDGRCQHALLSCLAAEGVVQSHPACEEALDRVVCNILPPSGCTE